MHELKCLVRHAQVISDVKPCMVSYVNIPRVIAYSVLIHGPIFQTKKEVERLTTTLISYYNLFPRTTGNLSRHSFNTI